MRFCVKWFICMRVIYCLGDLGNLIGKAKMMDLKIDIFLRRMEWHTHLHHYHLDMFMKTN